MYCNGCGIRQLTCNCTHSKAKVDDNDEDYADADDDDYDDEFDDCEDVM